MENKKRIYLIVAVDIESNSEITEEIIQDVMANCSYDFTYEEHDLHIVDTEIQDVSSVPFF
jgi:hypothetical protein